MSKKLIVFIDSGDTLVNEGTEYRNEGSPIVQSCELIDGAKEMLLTLKERGYTIELVADGYTQSFDNSYGQHGLKNIFDARTISEEVGEKKPSQAMFETAMKLLHLTDEDKKRIIMVGNNLERDIVGANRFGITSVFIKWSPRYPMEPNIRIIGMQFLDFFDFLTNSVMMPVAALMTSLLVSRVIGIDRMEEEILHGEGTFRRKKIFVLMIKYLCPVFTMIILASSVANAFGWISM